MVANFSATILVYPFTRQMCSPLSKFRYSTIVQADQKNKETPDFKGFLKKIERVMGIEPTYPAWKAGVLPLNYTRISVGVTGFEPATSWSQTRRSSQAEPHPDISFISLPLRLCVSFVSPAATRYIIWHVSQKVNRFFKVFLLFYDCFFTCFSQEECANYFFCFSFLIIKTIIDIFAQNSIFRPH